MNSPDDPIQKAMQEGQFDDLPGKGKPLHLDENPYADPEWELAQHLLQTGGFTLPWIETRREIEHDLAEARASLKRSWDWRQAAVAQDPPSTRVERQWQQDLQDFRRIIDELNKRIREHNLQAPADRFHLFVLSAEKEIASIAVE